MLCRHAERSSESKVAKSQIVKAAGGVGMILVDEDVDVAIPFVIPAVSVGRKVGKRILSYINNTRFVIRVFCFEWLTFVFWFDFFTAM